MRYDILTGDIHMAQAAHPDWGYEVGSRTVTQKGGTIIRHLTGRPMDRSLNGGVSWEPLPNPPRRLRGRIVLINDSVAVEISDQRLLRIRDTIIFSTDKGTTWRSQPIRPMPNGEITRGFLGVAPDLTFYLYTNADSLYFLSRDFGQTWSQSRVPVSQLTHRRADHLFGLQGTGQVAESRDGGRTWTRTPQWQSVPQWRTDRHAHAVVTTSFSTRADLQITTDSGRRVITHRFNGNIVAIHWPTANVGFVTVTFAVNDTRRMNLDPGPVSVFMTTDAGLTWRELPGNLPIGYSSASLLLLNGPRVLAMGPIGIGYEYGSSTLLDVLSPWARGRLRHDLDLDCLTQAGEPGLPDELIVARSRRSSILSFTLTDTAGRFEIPLLGGVGDTAIVQQVPSNPYQSLYSRTVCEPTLRLPLTGTAADTFPDLALAQSVTSCPILTVSIATPWHRPCMRNRGAIDYRNLGNAPTAGQIELRLGYRPLGFVANHPYTLVQGDSVFRFDLSTVAAGASGTILYSDSLECTPTLVGRLQCHQVRLTQTDSCPSPIGADLSRVTIEGRCLGADSIEVTLRNIGGGMIRPRTWRHYIDSGLAEMGTYLLPSQGTQTFRLPSLSSQFPRGWHHIVADPDSTDPRRGPSMWGFGCAPGIRRPIDFVATPRTASFDEACARVTTSYDPNDKLVSPAGFGPGGQVPPGTRLTYTIRFQNTGTDTAFVVTIRDTLPEGLDITTLRWGATSHPAGLRRTITGMGQPVLVWQWRDIRLPDSARSGPRSEGFVSFSISPERGLPLGTRIDNKAHIYFDVNEAVITPPVATTFDVVRLSGQTSLDPTARPGKRALALEPNPAHDQVLVRVPAAGTLTLLDAQGRVVRAPRRVASASAETLSLTGLPAGVYIVRLVSEGRGVWVERLVVR